MQGNSLHTVASAPAFHFKSSPLHLLDVLPTEFLFFIRMVFPVILLAVLHHWSFFDKDQALLHLFEPLRAFSPNKISVQNMPFWFRVGTKR